VTLETSEASAPALPREREKEKEREGELLLSRGCFFSSSQTFHPSSPPGPGVGQRDVKTKWREYRINYNELHEDRFGIISETLLLFSRARIVLKDPIFCNFIYYYYYYYSNERLIIMDDVQ